MADVNLPSAKEKLWHKMQGDLAQFVPEITVSKTLMCCCCGRFLPFDAFSLEHLIPQQAIKLDPLSVRENPLTPASVRAGTFLLCQVPLKINGKIVYKNGCNSWKGKHYDRAIRDLITVGVWRPHQSSQLDIVAAICLAYLGLVEQYGYRAALMQSGRLMREQFFMPNSFHKLLPTMSQMLLGGDVQKAPPDAPMWKQPMWFSFEDGKCFAGARNFSVILPITRDPRLPTAHRIKITPQKYKLRPDFTSFFE